MRSQLRSPENIYARESNDSRCDIRGHLPTLRAEARGNVLEIGVRGGASTSAFILGVQDHSGHVYSIDINAACGTDLFCDCDSEWTFIHGHSLHDAGRILRSIPICLDVLFIDGDHSYAAVNSDLATYGPRVKRGGVILLHDYELPGAGVHKAVLEYAARKSCRLEVWPGWYGLGALRV
jgi:predicted O-methyltransferase YrrM